MNEAEIADVLKARREEMGYKQAALAMSLGIHQRTIQRVERKAMPPTVPVLIDWCDELGLEILVRPRA